MYSCLHQQIAAGRGTWKRYSTMQIKKPPPKIKINTSSHIKEFYHRYTASIVLKEERMGGERLPLISSDAQQTTSTKEHPHQKSI